jgi:DNA-binding NarL/FixJ family response regulator
VPPGRSAAERGSADAPGSFYASAANGAQTLRAAPPIRVVVVDDQRLFADAIALLLRRHDQVKLMGIATNAEDGIELAVRHSADVVLMDVSMPTLDGLEGTRRLRALRPGTAVVMLSGHDGAEVRQQASKAGASAFLLKGSVQDEIVDAIVAVSPRR